MTRAAPSSPSARPAIGRALHALRTGWSILGLALLLLLAGELAGRLWLLGGPGPRPDRRSQADAYRGADWAPDYFAEFRRAKTRWSPYVYWRRAAFEGEFIRIDAAGLRRTPVPQARTPAARPLRVALFGGSAVWGTGARDAHTIPAALARELAERGWAPQVVNYGETGYVSTQEALLFLLELRAGRIPDLAVFYDGANDVFAALQSGAPGVPQNEYNRREEFNLLSPERESELDRLLVTRLLGRSVLLELAHARLGDATAHADASAGTSPQQAPALARGVVDAYAFNLAWIREMAAAHGVATLFYWQPVIFGKPALTAYERQEREAAEPYRPFYEATQAELRRRAALLAPLGFHDLSDAFAEQREGMFIDWLHVGEAANALLARRLAADVDRRLRAPSGGPPAASAPGARRPR